MSDRRALALLLVALLLALVGALGPLLFTYAAGAGHPLPLLIANAAPAWRTPMSP